MIKIDVTFLTMPSNKIEKQFPEIYKIVNEFAKTCNIQTEKFRQKLFHVVYDIKAIPLCLFCKKKKTTFLNSTIGYTKYCSCKCKANSPENKKKVKNTLKEKYGDEITNISQIESVKEDKKNTMQERYGVNTPYQLEAFRNKGINTLMENSGVTNPSYMDATKKKISIANKKANAENGIDIKARRKQTLKEKYNVENARSLAKNTRASKYEIKLCELLMGEKIIIKHREFDIFLKNENVIIEVDGMNFHPEYLKDIQFYQLIHAVNDIEKERSLDERFILLRIRTELIEKTIKQNELITLDFIKQNQYKPDRTFDEIIDVITKNRIVEYYQTASKKSFELGISKLRRLFDLLKGIKTKNNHSFLKEFYALEFTEKTILEEIFRNYKKDLKFHDVLCSREFLTNHMKSNGKDAVSAEFESIFFFIRKHIKEFIFPETTESLSSIFQRVKNSVERNTIENNVFENSISSSGNNYLKAIFKSYFHSSYKGSKTPIESFKDDRLLRGVLKYRIGLNDSGEIFDLSFKQIVKGFSAIRKTVSFFKPAVAAKIYENFLGDKTTPTVFDPCCGFGGRILGFFIQYPKGTYIGCEPNFDTYNELLLLKEKISEHLGYEIKCEIYNETLEEFSEKHLDKYKNKIDLTFTSIPYYDVETYSIDIVGNNYTSFDDWKTKFIKTLLILPNCYINLPKDLFEKLELKSSDTYHLKNNVARHFNKTDKEKLELIVKI